LSEWAREHDYRLPRAGDAKLPSILQAATGSAMQIRSALVRPGAALLELRAGEKPGAPTESDAASARHALVRLIQSQWPATALRPVRADTPDSASLVDSYAMRAYPTLAAPDRFTVHGIALAAARALASSPVRSLLPPDVGLLVIGNELLLDFSARPFDPVEFDRMTAVADQVIAHLPVVLTAAPANVVWPGPRDGATRHEDGAKTGG
jgi:hypothetical protein